MKHLPRPARTGLRFSDLILEAWKSTARNPGRSMLTAVGTMLGAMAFVATLGIAGTIGQQVSDSFDLRRATTVTVQEKDRPVDGPVDMPSWAHGAPMVNANELSGVAHAGIKTTIEGKTIARGPSATDAQKPTPILGTDAEALSAINPKLVLGRRFDAGHVLRADQVVMLSKSTAEKLQITRTGVAVYVESTPHTVIGIFDDVDRSAESLAGVIIPVTTTEHLWLGSSTKFEAIVETLPGAAAQVGAQIGLALQPNNPSGLTIIAPPDPQSLRQEVEGSITNMTLLVSAIALVIGAVSIGNAATASMVQRTSEIGLRRSLGARNVDIFAQLLGETTALGGVGGATGAFAGVLTTAVASLVNHWVPVLDLSIVLLAVAAGTAAGAIAGFCPALKATRIAPAYALTH